MKIGLLAGSFNPPHQGHLYISLQAKKRLGLKQIWWLPAKHNPLKKNPPADFERRFAQCQNLLKNRPGILPKKEELNLKSRFSIDLLRYLKKKYPRHQFYFIMGADNLAQFHLWRQWKKIPALAPLVIFDRGRFARRALHSPAFLFCRKSGRQCRFLRLKKIPLSSTQIRNNPH